MKPRIVISATVPLTIATALEGQPRYLSERFDVHLITGPGEYAERLRATEGVPVHVVPFTRQIMLRSDAEALARYTRLLRRLRPRLVHTYTPKAGLVGMGAAKLAGVPVRVHSIIGMTLMMNNNWKRAAILNATERATYAMATDLWANGLGLRDWVNEHLTRRPIRVVGHGSTNGIDPERAVDRYSADEKRDLRASLGIADGDFVFVFVGRIVRDKGIEELVQALVNIAAGRDDVKVLLVGDYERELDPVSAATEAQIRDHAGVVSAGWVDDVRPYLAISDVFVLPSYREGLPNSIIEASAMGLPTITTDILGCNEAVIDGENGVIVPPRDAAALEAAMRRMLDDEEHRAGLRARARASALERYSQSYFRGELVRAYEELLSRR